ncbi:MULTISPECIES: TonB-dependent receptor [unclassified Flavobacterium]|uniref:TonB-dependent receptor n=1 Tax=unclassified Flavobacterium TaxID=196869 RepID=UPI0008698EFF|nr:MULTISPECIES: TonB-dependent receptor [unclassified Flavobacterium]MBN9283492.1 TonB-dependent receptor [Flavobacterium sp.]ODS82033.1 MAG: hypothetical protein ABS44_18635 [Chryseobacterium sp. SCN 40-13]OJV69388.1 MAG: hypothetical protein BGO42_13550 [Flavobacterium sp. 40-81]
MRTQPFLVLCFLVVCHFGFSQNKLSGKVTNEKQQPLNGAHIHAGDKSAASNPMGEYEIRNLPDGNQKIFISYVGYKTLDTLVSINDNVVLNVMLKPDITALKEVVIREKGSAPKTTASEQKIKSETIERYSNQTLGDALKEVAGVSILKTGSTIVKPVINGLHSSRVPIINNNVRLEDQQWGAEHAPNMDINSAGKITVIKGASSLQYGGDAVGGIVIIEPLSVKKDTLFGKTIVNMVSNGRGGSITSSLHKGNSKGWAWNVLGTFKYLGDREAPDYVLSNTGNRESNFSGDLKYIGDDYSITGFYSFYKAQIGILRASHIGNSTDLVNSINNQAPAYIADFTYTLNAPRQEVEHHLAKINFHKKLDPNSQLEVQYAYQFNNRLEYDLRRGDNANKAALDLDLTTHALQADWKRETDNWQTKIGVNAAYQTNYASPATGIRPLIPNYDKYDAGAYAVVSHSFSDDFTLEGGLRYDYSRVEATKFYLKSRWEERGYNNDFQNIIVGEEGNQWLTKPTFSFHNVSGSIGARKEFGDHWSWLNNISLATRNPNPSEFFSDGLHHSTGMIELGDLRLKKEKALKFSSALSRKGETFSFEINPYLNSISDFMYLTPIGQETTIRGAFLVWEYRQTNARLLGIDVHSNWKINSNFEHDFALAYVNGRDLTNSKALIDMPPLNISNALRFTKKEWNRLQLELKSELVFRQNQYPNNNFITNTIANNQFVPTLVDISTPPKAYHLLHFNSEMKLKAFKGIQTTVGLSVQNIFNTNYRDYLNRQRFFADELGRNFQLQLKFNY